jgi:hypothetical protein
LFEEKVQCLGTLRIGNTKGVALFFVKPLQISQSHFPISIGGKNILQ